MENHTKRVPKWEPKSVQNRKNTEKGDQKTKAAENQGRKNIENHTQRFRKRCQNASQH